MENYMAKEQFEEYKQNISKLRKLERKVGGSAHGMITSPILAAMSFIPSLTFLASDHIYAGIGFTIGATYFGLSSFLHYKNFKKNINQLSELEEKLGIERDRNIDLT